MSRIRRHTRGTYFKTANGSSLHAAESSAVEARTSWVKKVDEEAQKKRRSENGRTKARKFYWGEGGWYRVV